MDSKETASTAIRKANTQRLRLRRPALASVSSRCSEELRLRACKRVGLLGQFLAHRAEDLALDERPR